MVTVDGGSGLLSSVGYLGYNSGSNGTVMVTGTGSTWTTTGDLYIGRSGGGTLKVEAGGSVYDTYACYLGYSSGSGDADHRRGCRINMEAQGISPRRLLRHGHGEC